eukprot:9479751-Pyramimonas_sp.AAC.2
MRPSQRPKWPPRRPPGRPEAAKIISFLAFGSVLARAGFQPSDSPKLPKRHPRSPQHGPTGLQDDLTTAEKASKTVPRGLQVRSRWPRMASKTAQKSPRWPPRLPERVQDASELAREASKTAHDWPLYP